LVLKSTLKEARMAHRNRKAGEEMAQEGTLLLDDPGFLRGIVERVLQELLEAEMTEHVGAAPYERSERRKGHRNGHKPRTLRTRVGTPNLLVPQETGREASPPGSFPATRGTRRLWCWR
jgi:transposase-like protein